MSLPLRLRYPDAPLVTLTPQGLAFDGGAPQLAVLVGVWDAVVFALAGGEIDLAPLVGKREAERRAAEARAALNVRMKAR